ncbi:MAG: glucose-6-phosphate isomerase [Bacteroidales bacterium]|nr:glucose-6-phosphate isomerase [Bacteroidales bacterium]
MKFLKVENSRVFEFVKQEDIEKFQSDITKHHMAILEKRSKGNDFLGWVDLPSAINNEIIESIVQVAQKIKEKAEVFVVIGIGGSYLGSRAIIEALNKNFTFLEEKKEYPIIIYAGQNISEDYLSDLLEILNKKEYALAVISKSGTTTEPAIAFRILKSHLEKKYGKPEAKERIIAITDESKGVLKKLATDEGYQTFVVPDDVGGRYSVLTPVGLLPIAVAGFNIQKLIDGARTMQELNLQTSSFEQNPITLYAATRNALYRKNKFIEILVNYQPNLYYFTEWWKQLYGESEGKEGKGIFPASVSFTSDLHSMGQYIQEGQRILFETILSVEKPESELIIPNDKNNLDGLNYIAGKRLHEVNQMAELGTILAHVEGGVPNIEIKIPKVSEYYLGQLIYFFEMACAISGYIIGVNPFDQPGVEAYKKNMFALLGKPGFEMETEKIRKTISS